MKKYRDNSQNKNKLILVDVDNTLTNETCWTPEQCRTATPKLDVIRKINELAVSNKICIYTARRDNLVEATFEWLHQYDVHYDMFSNKKVPGDLYIDNDAKRPDEL